MTTELSAYAADVFGASGLPNKPDFPVLFVAPIGDRVPDDGVFEYTTINDLSDVGAVAERSVILFRADQNAALSVLSGHGDLFGRAIQPLFGVPGCEYGLWFDDATFGLERVAYGAFVAELRAAAEVAQQLASSERSGTKIESDRYTTASGRVRYSNDIGSAEDSGDDDVVG